MDVRFPKELDEMWIALFGDRWASELQAMTYFGYSNSLAVSNKNPSAYINDLTKVLVKLEGKFKK